MHPDAAHRVGCHRAGGLADELRQVDALDDLLGERDQVDLRQGAVHHGAQVDPLEDEGGQVEPVEHRLDVEARRHRVDVHEHQHLGQGLLVEAGQHLPDHPVQVDPGEHHVGQVEPVQHGRDVESLGDRVDVHPAHDVGDDGVDDTVEQAVRGPEQRTDQGELAGPQVVQVGQGRHGRSVAGKPRSSLTR